jgi:hypothetical protein
MDIDSLFDKVFWIIFLAVVGTFAWKIWKNGGFRGAMFGSRVERLIGEVAGERAALHGMKIKVHKLAGTDGKGTIGVELVAKSFASYQMTPVTLSRDAALQLAALLHAAAQQ